MPPNCRTIATHADQINMRKENLIVLDGKRLYYSFLAGAHHVFENQKLLNKINVYPVPDADTGTNLASTFRSIVENCTPEISIKRTSNAIAEAALSGARGNSGIIIAQFLYGFANEIGDKDIINLKDFAICMRKAVGYAYKAISNPVEGTIITVLREWADFVCYLIDKVESFEQLILESLQKAHESLAKTPEKLKALAVANVVDAGAKGFVLFLEGVSRFLQKENLKKILSFNAAAPVDIPMLTEQHDVSRYRFCTEAMVNLRDGKREIIRETLEKMGDSLVIAGSEKTIRVHIHTNQPADVFSVLTDFGRVVNQKVDDMVKENEIATNRKYPIALMVDSTCDLSPELIDRYQIHMIPVNIFFGENQFLDRITITQDRFFEMLEASAEYPTSSQPSVTDLTNMFNYLSSHYESVIALHLSEKLSGTYANSCRAAEAVSRQTGKRIDVINSKQLSGTLGLVALRVAEAIDQGFPHDEIVQLANTWAGKARVLVGTRSLESFIKGGRVTATRGFIGKLLGIKPIITIDKEGKSLQFGKAFSQMGSLKKILKVVKHDLMKNKLWKYNIVHARNPETAHWLSHQMEKLTGQKPEFITEIAPVVAISAGRGTVALSVMTE